MEVRNCKNCVYASHITAYDNGCTAWECEYIPRDEAIKAWKEKHERSE